MSRLIKAPGQGAVSKLVKATALWYPELNDNTTPIGMINRKAIINIGGLVLSSDVLDFEFEIPFDDDIVANEAEIIIYNLSKNTLNLISINNIITISAGYGDDIGIIFKGRIDKVSTKRDGVDRVTTIKALDDAGKREYEVKDLTFSAGIKASGVLKSLLDMLGLNVAVFAPARDYTYTGDVNISGGMLDSIKQFAEICGISVYINKGMVYARKLTDGDNANFTVSGDTGLIGTPEEFSEEKDVSVYDSSSSSSSSDTLSQDKVKVIEYKGKGSATSTPTERANAYITAKDNESSGGSSVSGNNGVTYHDIVHGYNIEMLLQYHINTAAIININTDTVQGTYRVRKGTHRFNDNDCITECEVVDKV